MLTGEGIAPPLLRWSVAWMHAHVARGFAGACRPIFWQGRRVDRIRWKLLEWMPKLGGTMSRLSWLQKLYWTRFSKPSEERELFKHLLAHPTSSLLEVGIGCGARMQRIAKLVRLTDGVEQLRYIGIDEFESASDGGAHLRLKEAHQLATHLGFKASLIPGDHASAIPRVAHKMGACDIVIVDGGLDPSSPSAGLIGGWLNRLAHDHSAVFACLQPGTPLRRVDLSGIELLSARQAA